MGDPGFTIRLRGAPPALVSLAFSCPEHGVFDDTVPRGTSELPCPRCGAPAGRSITAAAVHTQFVVTATHGRDSAKPHPYAMDTRETIGEGMTHTEWKKRRAAMWEQERIKRVKEWTR